MRSQREKYSPSFQLFMFAYIHRDAFKGKKNGAVFGFEVTLSTDIAESRREGMTHAEKEPTKHPKFSR